MPGLKKSNRSPLLFVRYYRKQPTAQMGVFKRCVSIMGELADFDLDLLNFGLLADNETEFERVRGGTAGHPAPRSDLGSALAQIFESIGPQAVAFGKAPLRGSMRMAHPSRFTPRAKADLYRELLPWAHRTVQLRVATD
jgi:hypothetical protein